MKKFTLLYFFLFINYSAFSQSDCGFPLSTTVTDGNNISAVINNSGNLFFDGQNAGFFQSQIQPEPAPTIYSSGFWFGGLSPDGSIKTAACLYGHLNGNKSDYYAGPVLNNTTTNLETCSNWDKIWKITRSEIDAHRNDFSDNGFIDNPIPSIYSWPANSNPHFETIEGFTLPENDPSLAPFFDEDEDGIYNPDNGDFPLPNNVDITKIPEEITYCLLNDVGGVHSISNSDHLGLQIGQTTYSFSCDVQNSLDNTLFFSLQYTNKSSIPIDSFHFSYFTEPDLGCLEDDFIGSAPNHNSFFFYNSDNIDGNDDGICNYSLVGFGENPPVQTVTFLNESLDNFLVYYFFGTGGGFTSLSFPSEFYNAMTGRWTDGSPLEFGGNGFLQNTIPVDHLYPDDPNDANGWSMVSEASENADYRGVGSTQLTNLAPNESNRIDLAFIYVREEGASNLDNVTNMYATIDDIQSRYDNQFENGCLNTTVTEIIEDKIKVFPNPTDGFLTLILPDDSFRLVEVYNVSGDLLKTEKIGAQKTTQLNLHGLAKGIYFLKITNKQQSFLKKISLF